jgi:hypothetical protein
MAEYPECDRMLAVADDSHKLGEFLDWLNSQGLHLAAWVTQGECTWVPRTGGMADRSGTRGCDGGRVVDKEGQPLLGGVCPRCGGTGLVELTRPRLETAHEPYERLLARYFDIDLQKVEEERRAILGELS